MKKKRRSLVFCQGLAYAGAVKEAQGRFKTHTETRQVDDFTKEKTKRVKGSKVLEQMAHGLFLDNAGLPTEAALSVWRDSGGKDRDLDEQALKIMIQSFIDKTKAGIETEHSVTTDVRAKASTNNKEGVFLKTNEDGTPVRAHSPGNDGVFFSLKKPLLFGDTTYHSVRLEDGKISMRGVQKYKDENGVRSEEPVLVTDTAVLNNVAAGIGYQNISVLYDKIIEEIKDVAASDWNPNDF